MRPLLLEPDGDLTTDVLADVLSLVSEPMPVAEIERWSPLERAVVYDWAIREHLAAADNIARRRERPSLLDRPPAESGDARGDGLLWAALEALNWHTLSAASQRERFTSNVLKVVTEQRAGQR